MERRTHVSKDGEISHVNYQENVRCTPDGSETLLELFLNQAEISKDKDFLGTIVNDKLVWKSFTDTKKEIERLSSHINTLVEPKEIIGIYSVNRAEWIISEYASYMSGCINCPLYSTFSPSSLNLVLNETEMKVCVASSDKASSLLTSVLDKGSHFLKHIILMDRDEEVSKRYEEIGIKAYFYNDIINREAENLRNVGPKGSDLATICYTSGTSGNPKGVMLTQQNFISSIAAFSRGSTDREMVETHPGDIYLSYLPLAHAMERIVASIIMAVGGKIGFYRGNPKTIQADYAIIKPHFIASVPRVLNLFKEKIEAQVQKKNFILRGIFGLALKFKIWRQKHGVFKNWLLDALIFNKISKEFGGNIRSILCGSAPLKESVLEYIQATLSCHVFQGYGQTETLAANMLKPLDYFEFDTVGIPFPSNKVKLHPVQGYDQYSGEILLKGDCVTSGYYKRPQETKDLFTEDGWLKTGDIGRFHRGVFNIVGRRKEIFKTSLGEYIVPEKLETLYTDGEVIKDIFITGSKYSDKIAAIVVCPDQNMTLDNVKTHLKNVGMGLFNESTITKFEIPNHIIVIRDGFESFGDGEFVTPTAKKRRKNIEAYFRKEIDAVLQCD